MKSFDYDIALSFAGEDREFVEKCAEILRSLNVNVFYDNYEKHILFGKDLYFYLADLYHNRAKFAAVFISKSYKEKLWTNHELEFITERRFKQKDEYLLPIKLDDTNIEGIPSTVGYITGDSPLNVALIIAKKINPNLDFDLMINELKHLLPLYSIEIEDDMVNFECPSESFEASYPLGLMMELYRQNLLEPLFVMAAIVPN